MQAPGYVETNPSIIRYREYTQQLHKRKLNEIQHQSQSRLPVQPVEIPKNSKAKPQPFHEMERHALIKRENQLLLDKLVVISQGKRPVNTSNISKILNVQQPKSLNIHHRMKEAGRIAAENEALAKRLLEKSPHLSKKKLDMQYESAVKYKNQISKSYLFRRRTKSKMSLPPIEESKRNSPDKLSATGHRRHKSKKSLSPPNRKRNRSINLTEGRNKDKSMSASRSRLHPNKLSFDIEAKHKVIKSNESTKGFDYLSTERPTNEEYKYDDMNSGSQTERISIKTRESFRAYNDEMAEENEYMEDEYEDSFEDFEDNSHRSTGQASQDREDSTRRREISLSQKIQQHSSRSSLNKSISPEVMDGHEYPPRENELINTKRKTNHNSAGIEMSETRKVNQFIEKKQESSSDTYITSNHLNFTMAKNKSITSSIDSISLKPNQREITEDSSKLVQTQSRLSNGKDKPILDKKLVDKHAKYEDLESYVEDSYLLHKKTDKSSTDEYEIVIDSDQSYVESFQDVIVRSQKSGHNPNLSKLREYRNRSSVGSDVSMSSHASSRVSVKAVSLKQSQHDEGSDISLHSITKLEPSQQSHSSSRVEEKGVRMNQSQDYEGSDVSVKLDSENQSQDYEDKSRALLYTQSSRRNLVKAKSVKQSQDYEDKSDEGSDIGSDTSLHIDQDTSEVSQLENEIHKSLISQHSVKDAYTHSSHRSSKLITLQNSQEYQDKSNESSFSPVDLQNISQKSSQHPILQNSQLKLDLNQSGVFSHSRSKSKNESYIQDKKSSYNSDIKTPQAADLNPNESYIQDEKSSYNSDIKTPQAADLIPNESYIPDEKSSVISNLKALNLSAKSKDYEASPELGESLFFEKSHEELLNDTTSPIIPTNLSKRFLEESLLNDSSEAIYLSGSLDKDQYIDEL